MLPALLRGPGGVDLLFHSLWLEAFAGQLAAGEIYPRWLPDLYAGHGAPVFFVYPPLAYYVTSLIHWLLPDTPYHYLSITLSMALAASIAACSCFIWLKRHVDALPALIGAMLYILCPYYVTYTLHATSMLAQAWGYAWLPIMCLGVDAIVRNKRYGILLYTLSLAALLLSHAPSVLTLAWIPVCYGLYSIIIGSNHGNRLRRPGMLMLSITLGFGLAAIYVLPMLALKDSSGVDLLWNNHYGRYYADYFISLIHSPSPDIGNAHLSSIYIFLRMLYLVMAGTCGVFIYLAYKHNQLRDPIMRFWLIITVVTLILPLDITGALWKQLPILHILQFPHRFLLASGIGMAFMAAKLSAITHKNRESVRPSPYFVLAISMGICAALAIKGASSYPLNATAFNKAGYTQNHYAHALLPMPDYFVHPPAIASFYQTYADTPATYIPPLTTVEYGKGNIHLLSLQPRHIHLHASGEAGTAFHIRQFMHPLWQLTHGKEFAYIERDDISGQIRLILDKDTVAQDIILTLTPHWSEKIGKIISLITAIALIIFGCILPKFLPNRLRLAKPCS